MYNEPIMQTVYFGGGCFWCTEAIFQRVPGVVGVASGYSGGIKENPTYQEVSNGNTGHAEVLEVNYDPEKITFKDLLDVFFETHDYTSLNKQGADEGTQYRSIILYTNEDQKKEIDGYISKLENCVTEVKKFEKFYKAEEYHQNYYNNNQNAPYCKLVIAPKLEKFLQKKSE